MWFPERTTTETLEHDHAEIVSESKSGGVDPEKFRLHISSVHIEGIINDSRKAVETLRALAGYLRDYKHGGQSGEFAEMASENLDRVATRLSEIVDTPIDAEGEYGMNDVVRRLWLARDYYGK